VILPDPTHMELTPWAFAMNSAMSNYNNLSFLIGDAWQAWGESFLIDPSLSAFAPPDPYQFHDWRDWGRRLVEALNNTPSAPRLPGGNTGYSKGLIAHTGQYLIAHTGQYIVAH
jgi:hypothetical protein